LGPLYFWRIIHNQIVSRLLHITSLSLNKHLHIIIHVVFVILIII
jgi:hypothetical protein